MIKRDELISKLTAYFTKIYFDTEAINELGVSTSKYGIDVAELREYIGDREKLTNADDEVLFWIADCCPTKAEIDIYFSPQEIKHYSNSKLDLIRRPRKIEFKNVLPVAIDQYVTVVSMSQLMEMYNEQIIVYNTLTQRAPRISKNRNGETTYRIYVNESAVRSIQSLIEGKQFIPNDISLNVREEDFDNAHYDEETGTLTIDGITLDILDGYHRYQGILRAKRNNPDLNTNFILNIMMFDKQKAQRYIAQQDKKNKIKSGYAKALDDTRFETKVINILNDDKEFVLYKKFDNLGKEGTIDSGWAIDSLTKNFTARNPWDIPRIAKYLKNSINSLCFESGEEYTNQFDKYDFRIACTYLGAKYPNENIDFAQLKLVLLQYKHNYLEIENKNIKQGKQMQVSNLKKSLKEEGYI